MNNTVSKDVLCKAHEKVACTRCNELLKGRCTSVLIPGKEETVVVRSVPCARLFTSWAVDVLGVISCNGITFESVELPPRARVQLAVFRYTGVSSE